MISLNVNLLVGELRRVFGASIAWFASTSGLMK
jgi:hypothetical protein